VQVQPGNNFTGIRPRRAVIFVGHRLAGKESADRGPYGFSLGAKRYVVPRSDSRIGGRGHAAGPRYSIFGFSYGTKDIQSLATLALMEEQAGTRSDVAFRDRNRISSRQCVLRPYPVRPGMTVSNRSGYQVPETPRHGV